MVCELPLIGHVKQLCDTCVATKQRRRSFPCQALYRAQQQLELIHGDLCGPMTPATPGKRCYFLLLMDDTSWFMWALPSKGTAADAIKHVQAAAEESGHNLQVLHTDNRGEFIAMEFTVHHLPLWQRYSAALLRSLIASTERHGWAPNSDSGGHCTHAALRVWLLEQVYKVALRGGRKDKVCLETLAGGQGG